MMSQHCICREKAKQHGNAHKGHNILSNKCHKNMEIRDICKGNISENKTLHLNGWYTIGICSEYIQVCLACYLTALDGDKNCLHEPQKTKQNSCKSPFTCAYTNPSHSTRCFCQALPMKPHTSCLLNISGSRLIFRGSKEGMFLDTLLVCINI